MILRSSTVAKFFECPKAYQYLYEDCYTSLDVAVPLVSGLAFHGGLELRGQGKTRTECLTRLKKLAKPLRWEKASTLEVLFLFYWEAHAAEEYVYEGVEVPWSLEIGDVTLRGKFDGLVRDKAGNLWIMEHKTTTASDIDDPYGKYWTSKEMNLQIDLYLMAAKATGLDVKGVVYDVARIPKLKPLKATPKDKLKYYKRKCAGGNVGDLHKDCRLKDESMLEFSARTQEYFINNRCSILSRKLIHAEDRDLEATKEDMLAAATLIKTKARPRNTSSCYNWGRECDFRPVCRKETSLTNTDLYKINPKPLEY